MQKIYVDKVSGTVAKREGLEKAKEILRKADVLVVWRPDRLGCSIRDLINWIEYLEEKESVLRVYRNQLIKRHRAAS